MYVFVAQDMCSIDVCCFGVLFVDVVCFFHFLDLCFRSLLLVNG